MFTMLTILVFLFHAALCNAQTVICIAGQCLQGFPNTTLGATLTSSGQPTIQLLPGQYTSSTNPQLLHNSLTSSDAKLAPSSGFNATLQLPLNLALQPGMAIYSGILYSGQTAFSGLPNSPGPLSSPLSTAKSIELASNMWAKITTSSNTSFTIWESVPNVEHLPIQGSLTLDSMQSSTCTPACSSTGGVCSSSGQCQCRSNFQGSSCEECAKGFFGPSCSPCPSGCKECDDGITGTGACLAIDVISPLNTCNCLNGVCGSDGQCTCNAGWTKGDNGTACAKCADGFFQTSTGDCKVCQIGCATCQGPSGACTSCKSGFSLDPSDSTKCNAPKSTTSSGELCPDGSFSSNGQCTPCNSACGTCTGGTPNDCVECASGLAKSPNGQCVSADGDGVCGGSNGSLVVDNVKKECEACGARCKTCKIPGFTTASTIQQLQCTSCVSGSFLSNGACVDACPAGQFVSSDNSTCAACDGSCSTCAGAATFCTACPSGQLAGPDGKCVQSCPSNTFATPSTSPTKCQSCHPDCGGSCSGPAFNQCTSCPSSAPNLSSGRCLPVCESKGQFFDVASKTCTSCDGSCASCSGAGANSCLSCTGDKVLRNGTCVNASCQQSTGVISGLGVCLSELANTPSNSSDPTVSGIDTPTSNGKRSLEWWQILLMALGCAFIFVIIIWLWRRRARKQRAKNTQNFAQRKFNGGSGWRWRLVRFGEKLFGHNKSTRVYPDQVSLGDIEKGQAGPPRSLRQPSRGHRSQRSLRSEYSAPSVYSQATGPRKIPYVRQPIPDSRFSSASTLDPYYTQPTPQPVQPQVIKKSKNPFWTSSA